MMDSRIYIETAAPTASTPDFLARTYCGDTRADVSTLTDALPTGAAVADVGAGWSLFGVEAARLRPDINVIAVDIQYGNPAVREPLERRISENRPANFSMVAGDVLAVAEEHLGKFDAVYSHQLVPHLLRSDRALGRQAVTGMLGMLKAGDEAEGGQGVLRMGLKPRRRGLIFKVLQGSIELGPNATEPQIDGALDALSSGPVEQAWYQTMYRSGVNVLPKSRVAVADSESGRRRRLPQPHLPGIVLRDGTNVGNEYYSLFSKRGVLLAGRLGVSGAVVATGLVREVLNSKLRQRKRA